MQRRRLLGSAVAAALGAAGATGSRAQPAWPGRSVTAVVPFAAGGAGNASLRILAELIGPRLGQPIVVENRPGAGGIPGTRYVAKSPDDHLLLLGSTSMTIAPSLNKDLGYDIATDLQPVGMISSQPEVFAVGADSPIRSLDELLQRARRQEVSAGNSGIGTLSHLTTELLNRRLGTRFLPVAYKGDAVLVPDAVSNVVDVAVFNLPVAQPMIQSGRLRALAVTSAAPLGSMPGVPVLRSLGDDLVINGWACVMAARNVPAAGVGRLSELLRQALAEPGVRERFATLGLTPESGTPAELRAFVHAETTRWSDVVQSQNIKIT